MAPLLSIIIVAYKSRPEIEACLRSLPRTLVNREVEVILVDNHAADGTSDFVRTAFPEVRVIAPGQNLGFGRANNLGFARSSGECVLFLNPDTVCNETALAHCVERVQEEPSIGLISPKLVQADGSLDLACRRSIPSAWDGFCRASGLAKGFPRLSCFGGYNLTHRPEDGTYDVGAINGAFMLGRRAVLDQVARGEGRKEKGEGRREKDPEGQREDVVSRPRLREGFAPFSASRLRLGSDLPATRYSLPATASGPAVFDPAFFMYGDDLDLCIRVAQAGFRIVYDGRHSIVHLKGQSVGRDYDAMSVAIFDANRDVYLKHFGRSGLARGKWRLMFGAWKRLALWRAGRRGHRQVRPV